MTYLGIDIETYSSIDLTKAGVYAYTEVEDFEILLFGYAFDDEEISVIDLACGETLPDNVMDALQNPEIIKTAFNANFERTCLARHFGIPMQPEQWQCTQAHAYTLGLPGGLAGVAKCLKLHEQKMQEGLSLIRFFSVPRNSNNQDQISLASDKNRNQPDSYPEKWALFKQYCTQDVRVERDIRKKLSAYPMIEKEQKLWFLDQKINDFGVKIDRKLVTNAIQCSEEYQQRLATEAQELTGLDNPNSAEQLKNWLETEHSINIDSLAKEKVAELLKEASDSDLQRTLELRQEMSKTSIKKYEAMERTVCKDGRIRGLLQYYGANRAGRWAGRLVQVHNLPRNYLEDLSLARELLRAGDYGLLELLYGNVPDVLSQLIRTAFIPSKGCRFIVSDFSAIEARVIAWLAGEKWRLDVFKTHGKIYEASAAQMFKVPVESITKGSDLRQRGKVAELACIAEGQLVLTDVGLVPIEKITRGHKVWDGEHFVNHDGVIFRGKREVITYGGLTATKDHLVWVKGKQGPIQFGEAASSGAHLLLTGNSGNAIRLGKNYKPGKTMDKNMECLPSSNTMYKLQKNSMDNFKQLAKRVIKRLSGLFPAKKNSAVVRSKANFCKAALYQPKRCRISELWRPGNSIQIQFCIRSRIMDNRKSGASSERYGTGQNRNEWRLRTWQFKICPQNNQSKHQKKKYIAFLERTGMALRAISCNKKIITGTDSGTDYRRSKTSSNRQTEKLAANTNKVRVYDILNAGPNNRFTVSNCLVHNCGYQGGKGALITMGAVRQGLKEEELPGIIKAWRRSNPNIVRLWRDMENAAIKAVREKTTVTLQYDLQFQSNNGMFFIKLPSGRSLAYVRPKIETDTRFNKEMLTYEGHEQGQWGRVSTYGGKITENVIQGIARDCLADSMLKLNAKGYRIAFHVHDEVVLDMPYGEGSLKEVGELMSQPVTWAPGLPMAAAGFETEYYMKD